MYGVIIVCIMSSMSLFAVVHHSNGHTVRFTLFWLVTMSPTLPTAEWGEVYIFFCSTLHQALACLYAMGNRNSAASEWRCLQLDKG